MKPTPNSKSAGIVGYDDSEKPLWNPSPLPEHGAQGDEGSRDRAALNAERAQYGSAPPAPRGEWPTQRR